MTLQGILDFVKNRRKKVVVQKLNYAQSQISMLSARNNRLQMTIMEMEGTNAELQKRLKEVQEAVGGIFEKTVRRVSKRRNKELRDFLTDQRERIEALFRS